MKGRARSRARHLAVQGLYEWQLTNHDVDEIVTQLSTEKDMKNIDADYFSELLHQVPSHVKTLDEHITPFLDRPLENVDLVERAILRLGTYELANRPEIPYRVVINEAIDLAKTFGADQGHKFINGIMDKLARKLRKAEMEAHAKEKS